MAEISITVGGKAFSVACQDGEEAYLQSAAQMLDREAGALIGQIGRLSEVRMLLMAGLMLADRTAALEDRALAAEERLAQQEMLIEEMRGLSVTQARPDGIVVAPETVACLSELAAEAEALAEDLSHRTT